MNHQFEGLVVGLRICKNKSRTSILAKRSRTASTGSVGDCFRPYSTRTCGYVDPDRARERRFCDAPPARGSSYCAHHRALCTAAPKSKAGRAIAAALCWDAEHAPDPPSELAHLGIAALPEATLPEDRRELLALLDHPPPAETDESE